MNVRRRSPGSYAPHGAVARIAARSRQWVRGVVGAALPAAALMLSGCGLFGEDGPVTVIGIGTLSRDPDRAPSPLSITNRLLLDATAQGLVGFNADGQVEAGLAERWTVIDGGRSYIFRIRQARWASGQRVRAAEVAQILRNRIQAQRLRPSLRGEFAPIESVRAMTDKVIEIRLSRPMPYLLDLLAQPDLAIVNGGRGWGPWRVQWENGAALLREVSLMEMADRAETDGSAPDVPGWVLEGADSLRAVTRYDLRSASAVIGGRFEGWPYVAAAGIARRLVAIDPAEGLFGLAVVANDGPLANGAMRDAANMAIDRVQIVAAFGLDGWAPRISLLPRGDDTQNAGDRGDERAPAPLAYPAWVDLDRQQRLSRARAIVREWRAANDGRPVTIRIALPDGPGAEILFARLSVDLRAAGMEPRRVRMASDADLRLIDDVAPSDDPSWYLRRVDCAHITRCPAEVRDAMAALDAMDIAEADSPIFRNAEQVLTDDARFFALGSPLRWSLISSRVPRFRPNSRARHSLNHLLQTPD